RELAVARRIHARLRLREADACSDDIAELLERTRHEESDSRVLWRKGGSALTPALRVRRLAEQERALGRLHAERKADVVGDRRDRLEPALGDIARALRVRIGAESFGDRGVGVVERP